MLDDAAFYAANSLVSDRFLLTTAFNLHFTKPMRVGEARAEGRWISGKRRVFVAEARIVDSEGEECARGTGTFLRSHIALVGPRRLPRRLMTERLLAASRSVGPDPPRRGRRRLRDDRRNAATPTAAR